MASAGPASQQPPTRVDAQLLQTLLPRREPQQHKGHFGHVVVVAGSPAMPGAALLALGGALRSGAGRVSWLTDADTLHRAAQRPSEVLLEVPPAGATLDVWQASLTGLIERAQAVVVGPGLGLTERTARLAATALAASSAHVRVCFDADALTWLASETAHAGPLGPHVVLTPHVGEMSRLLRRPSAAIAQDPLAAAQALATHTRATCLLKGAPTYVAAGQGPGYRVGGPGEVGGPGLAHAGTGDVLSGLVGGLLAQGLAPAAAAAAAAWLHAAAGDLAAEGQGEAGMVASDVVASLGAVWRRLAR